MVATASAGSCQTAGKPEVWQVLCLFGQLRDHGGRHVGVVVEGLQRLVPGGNGDRVQFLISAEHRGALMCSWPSSKTGHSAKLMTVPVTRQPPMAPGSAMCRGCVSFGVSAARRGYVLSGLAALGSAAVIPVPAVAAAPPVPGYPWLPECPWCPWCPGCPWMRQAGRDGGRGGNRRNVASTRLLPARCGIATVAGLALGLVPGGGRGCRGRCCWRDGCARTARAACSAQPAVSRSGECPAF